MFAWVAMMSRLCRCCLRLAALLTLCVATATGAACADEPEQTTASKPGFTTETLHGRLVWLGAALGRRFGIETDADAERTQIALETTGGELVPLVKDFRTRGFWLDERLRADDVEMVVRRYDQLPAVQMVRWYVVRKGRKYELDYWCDICAIPMYELKTCDCCQGEIRLRERPAGAVGE